jgi:hypothetical protein
MISIREGVFETNSSSTHAIIINKSHIISEFIEGKHFINLATGNLVLEEDIEKERERLRKCVEQFIDNGLKGQPKDFGYEDAVDKWGMLSCHDAVFDYYRENIEDYDETELDKYTDPVLLRSDTKYRKQYIDLFIEKAFVRFDDMNEDCDLAYDKSTIFTDTNGTRYDAISVSGSDSYCFGRWPNR